VLLSWVNSRGIRTGAAIPERVHFRQDGRAAGLVALGFPDRTKPRGLSRTTFTAFGRNATWSVDTLRIIGVAMVGGAVLMPTPGTT